MELTEIIDMIAVVNDMAEIEKIEIEIGEAKLTIVKKTTQKPLAVESTTPTPLAPGQGFESAQSFSPREGSSATPGQVKFALDLANKIGGGNMTNVVNGLAHALETVETEILHPDRWATEMTRDHASEYIDVLETQYKKMKKQRGAWGE